MADVNAIAEYIYRRAKELGVDPNMALGIARYEGLNPNTIGSPTFGNKDAKGYSFGPFQLYSGSPDPTKIAPGGLAYEFQKQFGEAPSRDNWQQQVDFSLGKMRSSHNPWYAVRDQGGPGAITQKGRAFAQQIGLDGGEASMPSPAPAQLAQVGGETRPPVGTNTDNSMPKPVQPNNLGSWVAQKLGFNLPNPNVAPGSPAQPSNLGSYFAQQMGMKLPTGAPAAASASPMASFGGLLSAMGQGQAAKAPEGYEHRPDRKQYEDLFAGLLS